MKMLSCSNIMLDRDFKCENKSFYRLHILTFHTLLQTPIKVTSTPHSLHICIPARSPVFETSPFLFEKRRFVIIKIDRTEGTDLIKMDRDELRIVWTTLIGPSEHEITTFTKCLNKSVKNGKRIIYDQMEVWEEFLCRRKFKQALQFYTDMDNLRERALASWSNW